MFIINGHSPNPKLDFEIARLKALVTDLERARNGQHPSRQVIAHAPFLHNWQLAHRQEPCLMGTVTGHPTIKNDRRAMTSGLWLLSPALGYARTISRFYALGQPAAERSGLYS